MTLPLFERQVSVFHGSRDTAVQEQLPLAAMLERIRGGTYKPWIDTLRNGRMTFGEKAYKEAKEKSHGFTPCCALTTRANTRKVPGSDKPVKIPWPEKLLSTTGLVYFDIDDVDDPAAVKAQLAQDPRVCFTFLSPSARGVKVGVAAEGITGPDDYKTVWAALLASFQQSYPAIVFKVDDHVKFLNALCYVSYDPQLYVNPEATPFVMPPPAPTTPRKARAAPPPYQEASDEARAQEALRHIPADDYEIWLAVGMALHSTGWPMARSLWDTWSATSQKFDERTQDSKWNGFVEEGGRTIATMFDLAKKHGWQPPKKAAFRAPKYPAAVPQMWSEAAPDAAPEASAAPTSTAPAQRSPVDPNTFLTDDLNARSLVRDHGADFRHCSVWDKWLAWRTTHWQRDTSGQVMQFAKQTIKAMAAKAALLGDDEANKLLGHLQRSLSAAKLKAMLTLAQDEPGIPVEPDAFDRDPWLLNCLNGTVDLRTGTLRPHRKEDLITRCLDITYDPTAQCPEWEKFLWRIMGGSKKPDNPDMGIGELAQREQADREAREMIAFLQWAIGYSLSGSTREQCLFILYGITKTGKSTFLAVLRKLLGPYGTNADMETFMHKDRPQVRNDLADLAGKRLVCAVESQEGRRLNEALIKQLTGGTDEIKARFLFEEHFTFKPQFKVFLGTNHKPIIRDRDDAIWERIRLIPFEVQIPLEDRVKDLDETLIKELSGILAWAVKGCLEWQKAKDLKAPARVTAATTGYKEEMDVVGRFLKDVCHLASTEKTLASRLLKAYQEWSGQTALSGRAFAKLLTNKGYHSDHERTGTFWYGIGLPPEEEPAESKPEGEQSQQDLPGV